MSGKSNSKTTKKSFIKLFLSKLKKNTLAIRRLKTTIDEKHQDTTKVIDITNSVNDKLEVVHKLRNDLKIYKTINSILTNHYIKETRDHENTIDAKIINLKRQIKDSYDELKTEVIKMADSFASYKNQISAPIQNSNVIMVGNDLNYKKINEIQARNEIYNTIIRKIDKLFCNMVSNNARAV